MGTTASLFSCGGGCGGGGGRLKKKKKKTLNRKYLKKQKTKIVCVKYIYRMHYDTQKLCLFKKTYNSLYYFLFVLSYFFVNCFFFT